VPLAASDFQQQDAVWLLSIALRLMHRKTSCLVNSMKCHSSDLYDLNTTLNVSRTLLSLLESLLFFLAFFLPTWRLDPLVN